MREIRIFPDPILRRKCEPVSRFGCDLENLVEDMIETLRESDGVGLAAPQVGEAVRVIVIGASSPQGGERKTIVLVNPEVLEKEGEIVWNEGCLSFPGIYEEIRRCGRVLVKALTPAGEEFTVEGEGLLAVAIQHEIDHLEGVLIFDYMSYLRKKLVKRELKKKKKERKKSAPENRPDLP